MNAPSLLRAISRFLLCAALAIASSGLMAQAPPSFDSICQSNAPARTDVGPADLHPGRYFNPRRSGQGWDFFWYGDIGAPNRLFVVWYTHEYSASATVEGGMVPVWFGAVGTTRWESGVQVGDWEGKLYRFRMTTVPRGNGAAAADTFRQWLARNGTTAATDAEEVGDVKLFFGSRGLEIGGRPNKAAALWTLNANYRAHPHKPVPGAATADCLTNFLVDEPQYTPDQALTGVYLEDNASGWFWTPVYWRQNQSQLTFEHHGLAYFDEPTGNPRWLVGHPTQPAGSAHACANFFPAFASSGQMPGWWENPSESDVMCMARVGFPGGAYAPWDLDRNYSETAVAGMLRRQSGTSSVPRAILSVKPTDGWLTFARVADANGTMQPPPILALDEPRYAVVRKVVGLTRALLLDDSAVSAEATCLLQHNAVPVGACRLRSHWMTEGAYLNLSVRLKRSDPTFAITDNVEISRGLLRSPVAGLAVPLQADPASGPLVLHGEIASLEVFENPTSLKPVAQSATLETTRNNHCSVAGAGLTANPVVSIVADVAARPKLTTRARRKLTRGGRRDHALPAGRLYRFGWVVSAPPRGRLQSGAHGATARVT